MNSIGYARVSTSGQTLDAQLEQLGTAGCDPVFKETMSGARTDRPELRKALATLSEGDVLVITRLDRLARSTRDLLDIVHEIETKGAKLKALTDHGQIPPRLPVNLFSLSWAVLQNSSDL